MSTKNWSEYFHDLATQGGLDLRILRRVTGWIETSLINGKTCFVKSSSYDHNRRQYFQGVDPKKMDKSGDFVLFCGGTNNHIRDVFLMPWAEFFDTLRSGQPINTYKLPREYFQYKFYFRDRGSKWTMVVQPTTRSWSLDITRWRYDLSEALNVLRQTTP